MSQFPIPSPERDALEAEVIDIVKQLSRDELRVFRFMGQRMIRIGHGKYGPLDLEADRRSWKKERAEERSDWAFYDSCSEIAAEDARQERVRCFKADEAFARAEAAMAPLTGGGVK